MHGSIVDRFLRDVRNATVQIADGGRDIGRRGVIPMKLRTKLLLGYLGFIVALGVLGAWSARTLQQMSAVSGRIIAENYDSVVAAQDMKESLERQDSAAVFELLGEHDRASRQAAEHRARFDAALERAAANITEQGEPEIVDAIRRSRAEYYRQFDEFLGATDDRTARYFSLLEPQFNRVRADCDRLLRVNQEAMRSKADAASQIARRWFLITLALAVALMAAGVGVEISLSNAILGPVRQLTDATTRMAGGDLDAAVSVRSGDEIGALAVGFNRMAERIRELRRSDLGKLLIAQQTTEAAIDSLYDPVIVTDSERRVTRINPAAERLFGPRAEVVGKPIDVVVRDSRVAQAIGDVLQSGGAVASESPAAVLPWAVDGARRAFRILSTPMRDADARLVGAVTLLEDITHLSEISRLKSEFIAAASHELRTPLTSVQMGIHLLIEDTSGPMTERQRDILQVCREDTARLDRLMRELLDLSKIGVRRCHPSAQRGSDVAARSRGCGRAAVAGGGQGRDARGRRAAGSSARDRGSRPDRARDPQPGDQRGPRHAGRRPHHRHGRGARRRGGGVGHRHRRRDSARVPREDLRAVRARAQTRRPAAPASASPSRAASSKRTAVG